MVSRKISNFRRKGGGAGIDNSPEDKMLLLTNVRYQDIKTTRDILHKADTKTQIKFLISYLLKYGKNISSISIYTNNGYNTNKITNIKSIRDLSKKNNIERFENIASYIENGLETKDNNRVIAIDVSLENTFPIPYYVIGSVETIKHLLEARENDILKGIFHFIYLNYSQR